jgi:hypothetical protein
MSETTDWVSIGIALIAIVLTVVTLHIQRKHNRLSVRPIGVVETENSKGRILISVVNAGTGPMIIKSIKILDSNHKETDWPPSELYPLAPKGALLIYTMIKIGFVNHAIIPGQSLNIFQCEIISGRRFEIEKQIEEKEKIRLILKNYKQIRVEYTDIYNTEQPELIGDLKVFSLGV